MLSVGHVEQAPLGPCMTLQEVMLAHEAKSFDYRVIKACLNLSASRAVKFLSLTETRDLVLVQTFSLFTAAIVPCLAPAYW